jgi:hypothetical protein
MGSQETYHLPQAIVFLEGEFAVLCQTPASQCAPKNMEQKMFVPSVAVGELILRAAIIYVFRICAAADAWKEACR